MTTAELHHDPYPGGVASIEQPAGEANGSTKGGGHGHGDDGTSEATQTFKTGKFWLRTYGETRLEVIPQVEVMTAAVALEIKHAIVHAVNESDHGGEGHGDHPSNLGDVDKWDTLIVNCKNVDTFRDGAMHVLEHAAAPEYTDLWFAVSHEAKTTFYHNGHAQKGMGDPSDTDIDPLVRDRFALGEERYISEEASHDTHAHDDHAHEDILEFTASHQHHSVAEALAHAA